MFVATFDLSSKLIGVTIAQFKGETLTYVKTIPLYPKRIDGTTLGYTTKKPKKIGDGYLAFLKPGEHHISQAEAKRRASTYKVLEHRHLLLDIYSQIGNLLQKVRFDVLIIERNSSFNGILTTKLLAEIAGGLFALAAIFRTQFYDLNESTVRSFMRKDLEYETLEKDGTVITGVKWEMRKRLEPVYREHINFENITLDEVDSLVLLHYFRKNLLKESLHENSKGKSV